MKKANVDKAKKLIEQKIAETKSGAKRQESGKKVKIDNPLVFKDEGWDGW
ncbi:MAG TPA: hypothetical protein PKL83_06620 [bacterium]|nr:hypothetical protein [bacterium]